MSDRDTDYIGRVWYKIWMKEKTVIHTSIAQYLKYIKLTACTLSVTETKHCTKKFGKGSAVALHELDTFLSVQVHSILPFSVSLDGGWCSEHLRYWHRLFGIYMSDTCCLPVWAVTVEYHQYLGENPLRKQAVDSHLNTKGRISHGKKKAKADKMRDKISPLATHSSLCWVWIWIFLVSFYFHNHSSVATEEWQEK